MEGVKVTITPVENKENNQRNNTRESIREIAETRNERLTKQEGIMEYINIDYIIDQIGKENKKNVDVINIIEGLKKIVYELFRSTKLSKNEKMYINLFFSEIAGEFINLGDIFEKLKNKVKRIQNSNSIIFIKETIDKYKYYNYPWEDFLVRLSYKETPEKEKIAILVGEFEKIKDIFGIYDFIDKLKDFDKNFPKKIILDALSIFRNNNTKLYGENNLEHDKQDQNVLTKNSYWEFNNLYKLVELDTKLKSNNVNVLGFAAAGSFGYIYLGELFKKDQERYGDDGPTKSDIFSENLSIGSSAGALFPIIYSIWREACILDPKEVPFSIESLLKILPNDLEGKSMFSNGDEIISSFSKSVQKFINIINKNSNRKLPNISEIKFSDLNLNHMIIASRLKKDGTFGQVIFSGEDNLINAVVASSNPHYKILNSDRSVLKETKIGGYKFYDGFHTNPNPGENGLFFNPKSISYSYAYPQGSDDLDDVFFYSFLKRNLMKVDGKNKLDVEQKSPIPRNQKIKEKKQSIDWDIDTARFRIYLGYYEELTIINTLKINEEINKNIPKKNTIKFKNKLKKYFLSFTNNGKTNLINDNKRISEEISELEKSNLFTQEEKQKFIKNILTEKKVVGEIESWIKYGYYFSSKDKRRTIKLIESSDKTSSKEYIKEKELYKKKLANINGNITLFLNKLSKKLKNKEIFDILLDDPLDILELNKNQIWEIGLYFLKNNSKKDIYERTIIGNPNSFNHIIEGLNKEENRKYFLYNIIPNNPIYFLQKVGFEKLLKLFPEIQDNDKFLSLTINKLNKILKSDSLFIHNIILVFLIKGSISDNENERNFYKGIVYNNNIKKSLLKNVRKTYQLGIENGINKYTYFFINMLEVNNIYKILVDIVENFTGEDLLINYKKITKLTRNLKSNEEKENIWSIFYTKSKEVYKDNSYPSFLINRKETRYIYQNLEKMVKLETVKSINKELTTKIEKNKKIIQEFLVKLNSNTFNTFSLENKQYKAIFRLENNNSTNLIELLGKISINLVREKLSEYPIIVASHYLNSSEGFNKYIETNYSKIPINKTGEVDLASILTAYKEYCNNLINDFGKSDKLNEINALENIIIDKKVENGLKLLFSSQYKNIKKWKILDAGDIEITMNWEKVSFLDTNKIILKIDRKNNTLKLVTNIKFINYQDYLSAKVIENPESENEIEVKDLNQKIKQIEDSLGKVSSNAEINNNFIEAIYQLYSEHKRYLELYKEYNELIKEKEFYE